MATYKLGFHGIEDLTVHSATAGAAGAMPTDGLHGLGTTGARIGLAGAAQVPTQLLVSEDDHLSTDGSVMSAGARVATGSGFAVEGQAVALGPCLTVTTDGPNPSEITFHLLAIGGSMVGLLGAEPLQPGLTYAIAGVTAPDPLQTLRSFSLGDPPTGDAVSQIAKAWDAVLCFTHGTLVDTPDGPRLIEELRTDDLVTTLGNGSQRLRWIGRRRVLATEMAGVPDLQPVEFAAGAIGNTRALLVSPQHRILLNDWRAQVYFGEDQVLIPAKAMVNGTTIRQVLPQDGVTYIHLLFDQHEILVSEGALSESFHPGEAGLGSLDAAQRHEIEHLFPGLELHRRRVAYPIVTLAHARALRLPG